MNRSAARVLLPSHRATTHEGDQVVTGPVEGFTPGRPARVTGKES